MIPETFLAERRSRIRSNWDIERLRQLRGKLPIGKVFSCWTVVDDISELLPAASGRLRSRVVNCRCSCGTVKPIDTGALLRGLSKSCGGPAHHHKPNEKRRCDLCGFMTGNLGQHRLHCSRRMSETPRMGNEYEARGEITAVFLEAKDGTRKETIIDTVDLPKVCAIFGKWHAAYDKRHQTWYAAYATPRPHRTTVGMHRLLLDAPQGVEVDHIDHDGLNNRRSENLRLATTSMNQLNRRGPSSRSTTGVLGLTWNKVAHKWRGTVRIQGQPFYLGQFLDREHAMAALVAFREERRILCRLQSAPNS